MIVIINHSVCILTLCCCVISSLLPGPSPPSPGGPRSRHPGIHTSTLLFMLLMIFLICYFICGILYNRQKYGVNGMDALPNRDFWMELPGLIADGYKYITDKSIDLYHNTRGHNTNRQQNSATYEQI